MAPKHVPRQRKHKVLARAKHASDSTAPKPIDSTPIESNTISLPSVTVSEASKDAKRAALKATLPALPSGKKAKRLEKYVENKLKKDENRELIAMLGKQHEMMGAEELELMKSSKTLGQGRETKRQRGARALREVRRGLDLDGENEDVLFVERGRETKSIPKTPQVIVEKKVGKTRDVEDLGSLGEGLHNVRDEESPVLEVAEPIIEDTASSAVTSGVAPARSMPVVLGGGLKRPLEVDESGRPKLQKRQKRGGVKSKISLQKEDVESPEEPAWEGFSSESEMLTESEGDASENEEFRGDVVDEVDDEIDEDEDDTIDQDVDAAEMNRVRKMILSMVDKGQSREDIIQALNDSDMSDDDDDGDDDEDEEEEEGDEENENAEHPAKTASSSQPSDESEGNSDSSDDEDESEPTSEDDEEQSTAKQQKSSAFKLWADEQRNQAMGFQPTNAIVDLPKVENFQPRAPEVEPLPLELQPSKNLERKAYSVTVNRSADIQAVRLQLPVVGEEQKIMEAIHNNSTIVVYGATGSGKTTQIPQFLYEAGYGTKDSPTPGMIGVTQPRRVAAVSMAKRVGDELGDHGSKVAYTIRYDGNVSSETAIKFMTDGVLLREVAQDIRLQKYSAIVIDEAHERSINTDVLIGMLSRVVRLRDELSAKDPSTRPLKLIIMSATLKITDFTENKTLFSIPPPVLQAEGRQYPVTNHFARKTQADYVEEAFKKISRGHKKLPPGGFLVFLTGQNEINHLSKKLRDAFGSGTTAASSHMKLSSQEMVIEAEDVDFGNAVDDTVQADDYDDDDDAESPSGDESDENDDKEFDVGEEDEAETGPAKMHVLPLYASLSTKDQLRVFDPPPVGSRLVVLATNVAETSITIPGISFVFDCGRSKELTYDKQTGVQSYKVGWISKASASQRAGRAGRTGPGHCYKLYSSAVYERDFQEFAEPEIMCKPIDRVVLQLKAMNLHHVVNFPFPTPPDRQNLASAEKLLTYLTALTPEGKITSAGDTMDKFPISPRFARMLVIKGLADCLPYAIALIAALSVPEIFLAEHQAIPQIAPKEEGDTIYTQADRLEEDARASMRKKYNKVHHDFCSQDDTSDAIKLLQVVAEYAYSPTEAWCKSHFVHHKALQEATALRQQLTHSVSTTLADHATLKYTAKLPKPSPKQINLLKQMLAAGFIDHIAMRADKLAVPLPSTSGYGRKPTRAIDVPYVTLFPSHSKIKSEEDADPAVYIHPSSTLAHRSIAECPDFIIYNYLQKPQAPVVSSSSDVPKMPKTRMHALTDISGSHLAALAKNTPLLTYGKPSGKMAPKTWKEGAVEFREVVLPRYLRVEGSGGLGWTLPAVKAKQKNMGPKLGWVVV